MSSETLPFSNNGGAAGSARPSADSILQNLKGGDTALDFIKNNLKTDESQLDPQKVSDSVALGRESTTTPIQSQTPSSTDIPQVTTTSIFGDVPAGETPKETPKVQTQEPTDPIDEPDIDIPDSSDVQVVSLAENFKRLKTHFKETSKTLKQLQAEKAQVDEELGNFKAGKVVPDILIEQEERISQLEHYEKLHNLKVSKEFREKYISPIASIKTRLGEIAADYEIPKEVIDDAINLTNRRELNGFLSQHFDEVGALEVKQAITQIQELQSEARAAEAEPLKALNNLQADSERVYAERNQQRKIQIANKSKSAWSSALSKIREEGEAVELITQENDPEYNSKVVQPILNSASSEYGKLVSMLAELGIEDLPDNLANALARMVQLAHASAVSIKTRNLATKESRELLANTQRTSHYMRPRIGGANSGGDGGAPKSAPATPTDAANQLINQVMGRR